VPILSPRTTDEHDSDDGIDGNEHSLSHNKDTKRGWENIACTLDELSDDDIWSEGQKISAPPGDRPAIKRCNKRPRRSP
jgi:hypothetical protein